MYWPDGLSVRNNILDVFERILERNNFQEMGLPHLIDNETALKLDKVHPLSHYYASTSLGPRLAATHEAVFYSVIGSRIKQNRLPHFRLYCKGPAFRKPKQSIAAFRLGERTSYMEGYAGFRDKARCANEHLELAKLFYSATIDDLLMPAILISRPTSGNKPLYRSAICTEMLTPFGRTVTGPMFYFHDNIFWNHFSPRNVPDYHFHHFGVTDNLVINCIYNSFYGESFEWHPHFSPILAHIRVSEAVCMAPIQALINALRNCHRRKFTVAAAAKRAGQEKFDAKTDFRLGASIVVGVDDNNWNVDASYTSIARGGMKRWRGPLSLEGLQQAINCLERDWRATRDERLRQQIIDVTTFDQANEVIASGKVARFYMSTTPEYIMQAQKRLKSGEVLGHDAISEEVGRCILDQNRQGKLCYASRRV